MSEQKKEPLLQHPNTLYIHCEIIATHLARLRTNNRHDDAVDHSHARSLGARRAPDHPHARAARCRKQHDDNHRGAIFIEQHGLLWWPGVWMIMVAPRTLCGTNPLH